ncbi:uncharacterized protein ASCRUDRAFT_17694, partial [Ascoidea rubescens DSM 1968]
KRHTYLMNSNNFEYLKNAVTKVFIENHILISIDIEAFETNTYIIIELGLTIYDPRFQLSTLNPSFQKIHLIPSEVFEFRNGLFITDNKFKFIGESIILTFEKCAILMQVIINYYFTELDYPCSLVGHNVCGDIKWLKELGVRFPENHSIIDTQDLWTTSFGTETSSLGNVLRILNIPHSNLHNAGNDSYFTLILAMNLSDPLYRINNKLDSIEFIENIKKK